MTAHGRRLLEQTKEDLKWLATEFGDFHGTEHDLRRASPVVRRFLVDGSGSLEQVRKIQNGGGALRLEVFALDTMLGRLNLGQVRYAMSFGFRVRGRCHGPLVVTHAGGGNAYGDAGHPMVRSWLSLEQYMRSTSVLWCGRSISRRDIIKHIANRDGGAHHGHRPMDDDVEVALNGLHASLAHVGGYPPLYVELLACIQAITSSPTVMELFGLLPTPSPLFDRPSECRFERAVWPARRSMVFRLGTEDASG